MTARDNPQHAPKTAPNCVPLPLRFNSFYHNFQTDSSAPWYLHNHPSGDPTPSRADIDMTRTIIDVARPLGIVVHDHLIIARDGHASLKG